MICGLGVQLLLVRTADLGGALVYRHGVAVGVAAEQSENAPPVVSPSVSADPPDLVTLEDGSWTWTPRAGDRSVLGRVMERPGHAALELEVLPTQGPGLRLRVAGDGAVLLPGRFSGLRVQLDVDTSSFEGTLGPAVLVPSGDAGMALEWTDPGRVALVRTGEPRKPAAEAEADLPAGRLLLALSASEGHWKGFAADQNLLHAHGELADVLRPAIIVRGSGELTLHRIQTTSLTPSHH
jgi:hypothetical protein